ATARVAFPGEAGRGRGDGGDDLGDRPVREHAGPVFPETAQDRRELIGPELREAEGDAVPVLADGPPLDLGGIQARQMESVQRRAVGGFAQGRASRAASSSRSMAMEQPRGGAPLARPRTTKPPSSVSRPRSSVCTASTDPRFARSQWHSSPTSPGGRGSRVSALTTRVRTHGGATLWRGPAAPVFTRSRSTVS